MASLSKKVLTFGLPLLAAVVLLGTVRSARAQYYYVPPPDYYRNDTAEGTIFGGALGAITGAMVAGRKDRKEGAWIGAGVGALTGNLLGRSKDRADEYRAAAGSAAVSRANRQAAATAVTNLDLIRLTEAGVGPDVIISTMRARGARLDLSPDGLISLKERGVSDQVLIAAQQLTKGHFIAPPPARRTIIAPVPPPVIVAPQPHWMYRHPPHYHHRHWNARAYYHFRY